MKLQRSGGRFRFVACLSHKKLCLEIDSAASAFQFEDFMTKDLQFVVLMYLGRHGRANTVQKPDTNIRVRLERGTDQGLSTTKILRVSPHQQRSSVRILSPPGRAGACLGTTGAMFRWRRRSCSESVLLIMSSAWLGYARQTERLRASTWKLVHHALPQHPPCVGTCCGGSRDPPIT